MILNILSRLYTVPTLTCSLLLTFLRESVGKWGYLCGRGKCKPTHRPTLIDTFPKWFTAARYPAILGGHQVPKFQR